VCASVLIVAAAPVSFAQMPCERLPSLKLPIQQLPSHTRWRAVRICRQGCRQTLRRIQRSRHRRTAGFQCC
jgi:hypothetical protein